jgi:hypothetical protein
VIVREFWVIAGRENDFERAFRPCEVWVEFLRQSEQYLGTELRLESQEQMRYWIFDYWKSHWGFEDFRSTHQREYEQFNRTVLAELVQREAFVGSFYETDPGTDSEEGTDLVPS